MGKPVKVLYLQRDHFPNLFHAVLYLTFSFDIRVTLQSLLLVILRWDSRGWLKLTLLIKLIRKMHLEIPQRQASLALTAVINEDSTETKF